VSRIGRKPIVLPNGVEIAIDGRAVRVSGPKGSLEWTLPEGIVAHVEDGLVRLERTNESRTTRAMHGLAGALVSNMVEGVSRGFTKTLEIVGVGYRASSKGRGVDLSLGFSHPVHFEPSEDVTIDVPQPNKIVISGVDKQKVGQVAAQLRALRPPEPYKGKGVRYEGEAIRRKAGKTGV